MIELRHDRLMFSFSDIHPEAKLTIDFQRTLRIPDDGKEYYLPPGLGRFPLNHLDDYAKSIPSKWLEHGGVMLPMYQSEALWISFRTEHIWDRRTGYPFAIKVATGKINAISGDGWTEGLQRRPQNYMVSNRQPWIDGYCVEKGVIQQFVAMPLGSSYSTEEQITGEAEYGGIQIVVYPMKRGLFENRFPKIKHDLAKFRRLHSLDEMNVKCLIKEQSLDMGLAPGGRMRQEIYEDPFDLSD